MRFTEADKSSGFLIEAYGDGGIQVNGHPYAQGLILTPQRIIAPWGPHSPPELTPEHLEPLLELAPQVVVLGTGSSQMFPDPGVYFDVMSRGIGFEIMDTGAACRTYNILVSEGRRVAAALLCC
ncbi:Mth938-like domain-containing protein [Imhoffiella purpurea]|uniref:Uncharacterized protein n=1 Tax=Imhoffiella purpurea TaxID=1249627 RepID=W9VBK4_9GAMM|nr:Mth938-like domain-containing protein [Imhoffiella purpurea]EXJ14336.1 hypothetical protein D779_2737 [Imhoffiella purpurea]